MSGGWHVGPSRNDRGGDLDAGYEAGGLLRRRRPVVWSLPGNRTARGPDARPMPGRSGRRHAMDGETGREKLKVAPRGSFDVAHSRPPCASMIERLIDSPIPVPSGFVVKNALKTSS